MHGARGRVAAWGTKFLHAKTLAWGAWHGGTVSECSAIQPQHPLCAKYRCHVLPGSCFRSQLVLVMVALSSAAAFACRLQCSKDRRTSQVC